MGLGGAMIAAALLALAASAAAAQETTGEGTRLGPETNLPLPRFVTLNVEEANLRRGPSTAHRIDWVLTRRGTPLEVIAEHGLWRKVRDQDDSEGWIHHAMLRNWRSAVVTASPDTLLRRDPVWEAPVVARAEAGVFGRIDECTAQWCLLEAGGYEGWVPKADLWGVRADERFD